MSFYSEIAIAQEGGGRGGGERESPFLTETLLLSVLHSKLNACMVDVFWFLHYELSKSTRVISK